MLIDELRKGLPPEDHHLEYKASLLQPRDLAPLIAAFANSDGGYIVFGIWANKEENKTVIGIDPAVPASEVVYLALKHLRTRPRVYDYDEVLEGKRIYIVEVEKSSVPIVTNDNATYIREGAMIRRDPPIREPIRQPSDNPKAIELRRLLDEMMHRAN